MLFKMTKHVCVGNDKIELSTEMLGNLNHFSSSDVSYDVINVRLTHKRLKYYSYKEKTQKKKFEEETL